MVISFIKHLKQDCDLLLLVLPHLIFRNTRFLLSSSGERMLDILILGEDHRNKYHIGFDIIAICRATYRNYVKNHKEGASTIDQQLVRVIIGDYRPTFTRKIKEILLAVIIRCRFDRRQLAISYLDIAYYGTNYQSLDSMLEKFGLSREDDIDLQTCASIVARLKYPEPKIKTDMNFGRIERRTSYLIRLYLRKHPNCHYENQSLH